MSNWPREYNEFFSRLKGVKQTNPKHWMAFCPGHDNSRTRALSIEEREDRILMKCMSDAACANEQIVKALGLDFCCLYRDGLEWKHNGKEGILVESYDYRDLDGTLLYQVSRWLQPDGSKTFNQRRPNPAFDRSRPASQDNKAWIKGHGPKRILYRLTELLQALDEKPERWVWVVEGEKGVDRLRQPDVGLVATTNDGGALQWTSPNHLLPLRGCNVAVVTDNDPEKRSGGKGDGLRRGDLVCQSLYGLAKEVRWVGVGEAGTKAGLDDWFLSYDGPTEERRKELFGLLQATPPWKPNFTKLAPDTQELLLEVIGSLTRSKIKNKEWPSLHESVGRLRGGYLDVERLLLADASLQERKEDTLQLIATLFRSLEE